MARIVLRYFIIILIGIVSIAIGWTWLTLNWSYSEGERAGYVQKFSSKGWLCKTWEGEIAMVTMPGAIPEKFNFSVRDDTVARRINTLSGRRVVLVYEQHKFIPLACFGETEYFVTDVRLVEDSPATTPLPPTLPGAPGHPG
jgi:hypothetical protein